KTVSTYKDEITCSMCLQIFTYPVSLRCSHSFCLRCIQDHLKHKLASDKYSCPECHSVFEEKPRLLKNTDLSDKVEQLSKYQESRIFCDYCLEDDVPAVMGCVQCEAFFCVTHLRPHSEKVYLKEHVLLEPTEVISLHKCMEHKEVLKLYCKEDRVCVCMLCSIVGQHKQHTIVTIEEAKNEVQVALLEKLKELNAKKMKTEKEVKHLSSAIENYYKNSFLSPCSEKVVHLYKGIKTIIEEDEQQTLRFIEAEKQASTLYVEYQTKEKVEELDDFRRTIQQINTLLNQSDTFRFLQASASNSIPPSKLDESSTVMISSTLALHKIVLKKTAMKMKKTLKHTSSFRTLSLSGLVQSISNLIKPKPATKYIFKKNATTVTLDPVTANENLILSEDRTIVRYTDEIQKAPYSPKRFDDTLYVLGSEGFTFGRHYWEVVVKNKTDWEIGAAYPSLPRKGQCWLGRNNVSWSLECSSGQCIAWRNNVPAKINIKSKLERVGVYLDYTGGMIAFYDADNMSLLMSFYNKFTEAVYPVLNPCNNKYFLIFKSTVHASLSDQQC
uniref:Tripartite motif containing 25 n=1 Tax=Latimeria chalumnae TaxID=7897 RepID=H3A7V3_LATCH